MDFLQNQKQTLRNVLAVCMVVAGLLHFVVPEPFIRIVPPLLPVPAFLVFLSGAIEIALGIGLLVPVLRQASAWGLVILFIAVYPANLYMAFSGVEIQGIPNTWWFQAVRLPFQFVLIAWAYWYTRPAEETVS